MNAKQSKIFNKILDLNHDMIHENKNFTRKFELAQQLSAKKDELKKSMGEAEYNKFMDAGTKMFS
jgi:hypothetical protein